MVLLQLGLDLLVFELPLHGERHHFAAFVRYRLPRQTALGSRHTSGFLELDDPPFGTEVVFLVDADDFAVVPKDAAHAFRVHLGVGLDQAHSGLHRAEQRVFAAGCLQNVLDLSQRQALVTLIVFPSFIRLNHLLARERALSGQLVLLLSGQP